MTTQYNTKHTTASGKYNTINTTDNTHKAAVGKPRIVYAEHGARKGLIINTCCGWCGVKLTGFERRWNKYYCNQCEGKVQTAKGLVYVDGVLRLE